MSKYITANGSVKLNDEWWSILKIFHLDGNAVIKLSHLNEIKSPFETQQSSHPQDLNYIKLNITIDIMFAYKVILLKIFVSHSIQNHLRFNYEHLRLWTNKYSNT